MDAFNYQSFDDAPGMVDSRAKLQAFKLPPLTGKSFFDIACNEGFYCGHALKEGASRVVGLDSHPGFIERARKRFPQVEYLCQSWDSLPAEQFDVILFASAMHYVPTRGGITELLHRMSKCLTPDGVLVLEIGIAPGQGPALIEYPRSDGSRVYYPTFEEMEAQLDRVGLSFRHVGLSEPGDGVVRHVLHCRLWKPMVLFVTGPSGSGKSSLMRALRDQAHYPHISFDQLGHDVYRKSFPKGPATENGAVQLCLLDPVNGAVSLADALVAKIRTQAKTTPCVVVDGLDTDDPDFAPIYDETVKRLSSGFVCWVAKNASQLNR